jgi:hypothetical protein
MIAVLSLTLLGFFLGMRHATDPDHVIAVSTIVTRQPTVRAALLIGSLWGVGHTLNLHNLWRRQAIGPFRLTPPDIRADPSGRALDRQFRRSGSRRRGRLLFRERA